MLAIGLDPSFADLSAFPTLSVDLVRAYIDDQIDRLRANGLDTDSCLVDRGESAERVIEQALQSKRYDCIVIGAGLRQPPELLPLFEKVINLVHQLAPHSRIAFNSTPADTLEAVQRWMAVD
ncbi:hypothetical protein [Sphingomonas sp. PR090111-T3T-6A]|uniref:hypothetical protein n=1 Tax=Sphingomonas sp. PR090111-T3T-6A TaxID=685778 RepID=UPI000380D0D9|nr:hypothetical protein [Sphingomonas sp. PR090111-T3T-6A]